jgi:hypothetical protein
MRKLQILILSLLCLIPLLVINGCATTDVISGAPIVLPAKDKATIDDALVQLANNPLIAAALQDADATVLWVNAQKWDDPMKLQLALACPAAIKAAATDFHDKVLLYKAKFDALNLDVQNIDLEKPQLVLRLTQLKYGVGFDPKAELAVIRADVNLRLDALFTGCAHLFPKKQMNELLVLAGKAGLLSTGIGGIAALGLP